MYYLLFFEKFVSWGWEDLNTDYQWRFEDFFSKVVIKKLKLYNI
jgi:hypothetical protein